MKIEWYPGNCGFGHPVKRPWQRTLAIIVGDKRFEFSFKVRPANPWRIGICGKCLGIK